MKPLTIALSYVLALSATAKAAPGDPDPTLGGTIAEAAGSAIAPLPDGRILSLGSRLQRFDRFGNADPTFSCDAVFTGAKMEVLRDGRIMVFGITSLNGRIVRYGVAAFSSTGVFDESYDIGSFNPPRAWSLQPDGGLVVAGSRNINGIQKEVILKFQPDGTEYPTFTPSVNGVCKGIFTQTDGKILICGSFTTVGGLPRVNAARLLPDGSPDPSFTADCGGGSGSWIVETPDHTILIGGDFTTVNGTSSPYMARVDSAGALDGPFDYPTEATRYPNRFSIQADGKIPVIGTGRTGLFRVDANGAPDSLVGRPYTSTPETLAIDSAGSLIVAGLEQGGQFLDPYFDRFLNSPGTSSLTVNDGDTLEWTRSGSLPEIHSPVLETANASGEWGAPVSGARQGGKWVFNAPLPADGAIRVSGKTYNLDAVSFAAGFLNLGSATPDIKVRSAAEQLPSHGAEVTYSPVFPGFSRTMTFTIINNGDGFLENLSTTLSGTDAAQYAIVLVPVESLAPGGTTHTIVRFNADTPGQSSAALTITSSDPDSPVFTVNLEANSSTELSPVFRSSAEIAHIAPQSFDGINYTFGTLHLEFAPEPGTVLTLVRANFGTSLPFSDLPIGSTVTASYEEQAYTFLAGRRENELFLTLVGDGTLLSSFDPALLTTSPKIAVSSERSAYVSAYQGTVGNYRLLKFKSDGTRDPLFDVSGLLPNIHLQPDGKVLSGTRRFHQDGTPDSGFAPDTALSPVVLGTQPDGKILIARNLSASNSHRVIARINPDGSADPGFSSALPLSQSTINDADVLPDGDILVSTVGATLKRLNSDGTLDGEFQSLIQANQTAIQSDGKILVLTQSGTGTATQGNLKRLAQDGSTDPSFNIPVFLKSINRTGYASGCSVQSDGKIIVCGYFDSVNGIPRRNVARLLPDGQVDTSFRCDTNGDVGSVAIREDGTAVIAGSQTEVSGLPSGHVSVIRCGEHNSEMSLTTPDTLRWERSGACPDLGSVRVESLKPGSSAWSFLGNAQRVAGTWEFSGTPLPDDTTYCMSGAASSAAPVTVRIAALVSKGTVFPEILVEHGSEILPNGSGSLNFGQVLLGLKKELVLKVENRGAGTLGDAVCSISGTHGSDFTITARPFSELLPLEKQALVIRLNPGAAGERTAQLRIASNDPATPAYTVSLDATGIDSVSPAFPTPQDIPVTASGFDTSGLMLGQISLSFAPLPGTVLTVVRNTGTDPISGEFPDLPNGSQVTAEFGGTSYGFLASYSGGDGNDLTLRLLGSGVIDRSFSDLTEIGGYGLAIQADGKILATNDTGVRDGVFGSRLRRFLPDGTPDSGFNIFLNHRIESLAVQADGRIVIVGLFSEVAGVARDGIARLLPDGRLDPGFVPQIPGSGKHRVLVLRSGKILVGGQRTLVSGTTVCRLARLNPDGTHDTAFQCDFRYGPSSGPGYSCHGRRTRRQPLDWWPLR